MRIAGWMLCVMLIGSLSPAHAALLNFDFYGTYQNLGPCWGTGGTCPPGEPSEGDIHISFRLDTSLSEPGSIESNYGVIGVFNYSGGFSNLRIDVEGFGRFEFDSGFDAIGGANAITEAGTLFESYFVFQNLAAGLIYLDFLDVDTRISAPLDPSAYLIPQLPRFYLEGLDDGYGWASVLLTLGNVTTLGAWGRVSVVEVSEPPPLLLLAVGCFGLIGFGYARRRVCSTLPLRCSVSAS